MKLRYAFFTAILIIGLTACGGGGGSSDSEPDPVTDTNCFLGPSKIGDCKI